MSKAVVVLSGGQDSTTCLFHALQAGHEVHAITFNYNQRHIAEVAAAQTVATIAGVPHEVIHLGPILKGTSPLVSDSELEQYEDHQSLPGGLEDTFVPMRNQLFLTIAANRAYVLGAHHVVTGVAQEDFGGYPDCRREFISALETASSLGTFTGETSTLPWLEIHTPLMYMNKDQTVRLALTLDGCYEALAFTHTAYDGLYPPTGKDHASLLRAKGFEFAGVPDPLVIRAAMDRLMELPDTPNYAPDDMKVQSHMARIFTFLGKHYAILG